MISYTPLIFHCISPSVQGHYFEKASLIFSHSHFSLKWRAKMHLTKYTLVALFLYEKKDTSLLLIIWQDYNWTNLA